MFLFRVLFYLNELTSTLHWFHRVITWYLALTLASHTSAMLNCVHSHSFSCSWWRFIPYLCEGVATSFDIMGHLKSFAISHSDSEASWDFENISTGCSIAKPLFPPRILLRWAGGSFTDYLNSFMPFQFGYQTRRVLPLALASGGFFFTWSLWSFE